MAANTYTQMELPFTVERIRYTGHESAIGWEAVSGLDLASNPRLLARWINSPEKKAEERLMRKWSKQIKERRAEEARCRRDKLRFRSGRELIYMGGFNTGGGTFQQLLDVRAGKNDLQTIPQAKFDLLQKSGRAVFVKGGRP